MASPRGVVVACLAAYAALVALFLTANGGDPAWFVHFGEVQPSTELGQEVLGPDLLVPHTDGHDGSYFWVLARDPLLTDPDLHLDHVDRPAYRSQRILYPVLAAPARLLSEHALLWGMLAVNLALVGAGTWWTARLALSAGAPARAAVWFALNPAVVVGVFMDTADVAALAFCLAGLVAALAYRRPGVAGAAFAASALAKEILVLVPLALAARALARDRDWHSATTIAGPPVAAVAAWWLYVRVRLGWPPSQIEELAAPLTGFRDAWVRGWAPFGDWGHAAVAGLVLVIGIAVVVRWWRHRSALLVPALPFAALLPFTSAQVVNLANSSVRALGPALTVLALDLYAGRAARSDSIHAQAAATAPAS